MSRTRAPLLFALVALLFILEGSTTFWFFSGSWNSSLTILNMALISAIMALGVNLQWGFAGLFNIGVMGFVALGGLATVLISVDPVPEAWAAGGQRMMIALVFGALTVVLAALAGSRLSGRTRIWAVALITIAGYIVYRMIFNDAADAIEAVNPAGTGFLGGLGLPIFLAWPAGGLLAAGAAWLIGKTALGLRSDYLAIATLGIAEITIAILKNEDWLARGVKNVLNIPRAMPREIDLQQDAEFVERAVGFGLDPTVASTLYVKLGYSVMFTVVLLVLLVLAQLALKSPWGRLMRAIRDNEDAAEAMGKDVTRRHLQIFILGSAVCGIAGAMMTTLEGQLIPTSYQPLRFTFLIWVMVIVGGSGNNLGAVLGGFVIWFLWVQVPNIGLSIIEGATYWLADDNWLKHTLIERAAHMRMLTMGVILLLVLRFSPNGLLPEK